MSLGSLGLPETLAVGGQTFTRNERQCYPVKEITHEGDRYVVEIMVMITNVRIVLTYADPTREPQNWVYERGYCYPQAHAVVAFAAALEWTPFVNEPAGYSKRAL